MTYVLYLNLWGTTAKLPPDEVVPCQRHFHAVVREKATAFGVEAYALVDYAYVYSSDLQALCSYAVSVFGAMLFPSGETIWPLRGAIAEGCERASGFSPIPWVGIGAVHAAELEKSAQKGMRLLIDSRAVGGGLGSVTEPVRDFAVRGSQHFEINWMKAALAHVDRERVLAKAAEWMEEGTNYSQQLSASLSGLVRWSEN